MDQYLSLISSNRTVDLRFDTVDDRDDFKVLLDGLVRKEHGQLLHVEVERPGVSFVGPTALVDALIFDWLMFYAAFGRRALTAELKNKLLRRLNTSLL